MSYPNFIELKKRSLACRSKKVGRLLTRIYRLWYDKDKDIVKLLLRDEKETLVATTYPNNNTIINIPNNEIDYNISSKIIELYGVRFKAIPKKAKAAQFNTKFIETKNEKHIYIPNNIKIHNGIIIYAADYYKADFEDKWNKSFIQKSKKNRAAFTALHNIIPVEKSITDEHNIHFTSGLEISQFVLKTDNPNIHQLEYLRNLLGITNLNNKYTKIRSLLQEHINFNKYKLAKIDNAVVNTRCKNVNIKKPESR